jgi:HEAT repeat protein
MFAGPDEAFAAAAVRGLAGRPEAHAELVAALGDPREKVRRSANLSLGFIASGLSFEVIARIEAAASRDPELGSALAYYGARQRAT